MVMEPPERPSKRLKGDLRPLSSAPPQFSFRSFHASSVPGNSKSDEKTETKDDLGSSPIRTGPTVSGKGKRKEKVEIIDLTMDDEEEEKKVSKRQQELLQEDNDKLWVDKYSPRNIEEVSVHPKKILQVRQWLTEAYSPNPKIRKYRRVLVLSGPSGSGKTAVLHALSDEMGIECVEYGNGGNLSIAGDGDKESMMNRLGTFLHRAGMAPALDFGPPPSFSSSSTSLLPLPLPSSLPLSLSSTPTKNRLLLLEDLPNTSHYPTKLALRSSISQYLSSPRVTCPLVVIISEALVRPGMGFENENTGGEDGGRGESLDCRNVLGGEVLGSPGLREIAFNPIAVTIMKKALLQTLDKIYSSTPPGILSPSLRPSLKTLELIISHSNGDIRSALMSLEFLANNPDRRGVGTSLAGGGGEGKNGKKRKLEGGRVGEEEVKRLLQFVSARESSLFLFHALGKVFYNKRWGQDEKEDKKDIDRPTVKAEVKMDRLPKHLRKEWSRLPSKVDPDVLFAEAPIDSDIFLSYVHHNYPAFTNAIEECQGIMENMSAADGLMRLEGDDWLRRANLTSQYSFNVTVRATLLHLPTPVPRRKQVIRKSELWDNLKQTRKNEEEIDDLYRRRDGLAIVKGWTEGQKVRGGNQRSKRSLLLDLIPTVGKLKDLSAFRVDTRTFLKEVATFPPVVYGNTAPTGEALGEKEINDDEEGEGEGLEDRDDKEEEELELKDLVEGVEELFDVDDDIED